MNTVKKASIPKPMPVKEIRTPEGMIPFTPNAVVKYMERQHDELRHLHNKNKELFEELEEIKKKLAAPKLDPTDSDLLAQARTSLAFLTEVTKYTGMDENQARKYQCLIDVIVELRP